MKKHILLLVLLLSSTVSAYNNTYLDSSQNVTGADFVDRMQDTFAETTLKDAGSRGGTFGGYLVLLIFIGMIYFLMKVLRVIK